MKFDIFSRGELVCVCVCLARAALLLLLLIKIPGAILLYRIETRHNRTGFLNLFFFFFLFLFYNLKMHRPAVAYFSSLFFIVLFCFVFLRCDTWPTCSPWWQREEKQELNDQRAAHAIGKCRTFRYINRRIEFNSNNPAPHFQKQKTATTWTTICVRGLKFFFFFF